MQDLASKIVILYSVTIAYILSDLNLQYQRRL